MNLLLLLLAMLAACGGQSALSTVSDGGSDATDHTAPCPTTTGTPDPGTILVSNSVDRVMGVTVDERVVYETFDGQKYAQWTVPLSGGAPVPATDQDQAMTAPGVRPSKDPISIPSTDGQFTVSLVDPSFEMRVPYAATMVVSGTASQREIVACGNVFYVAPVKGSKVVVGSFAENVLLEIDLEHPETAVRIARIAATTSGNGPFAITPAMDRLVVASQDGKLSVVALP